MLSLLHLHYQGSIRPPWEAVRGRRRDGERGEEGQGEGEEGQGEGRVRGKEGQGEGGGGAGRWGRRGTAQ